MRNFRKTPDFVKPINNNVGWATRNKKSLDVQTNCSQMHQYTILFRFGCSFRQLQCFRKSLGDFKLQFPEFYPCDWSLFRFNLSWLRSLISEIRLGGSKSPAGIAQGPSCARAKKYPKSQERLFVDLFRP